MTSVSSGAQATMIMARLGLLGLVGMASALGGCHAHKSVGVAGTIDGASQAPPAALLMHAYTARGLSEDSLSPHLGAKLKVGISTVDLAGSLGLTSTLCTRASSCGYLRGELELLNLGYTPTTQYPYAGSLGAAFEVGLLLPLPWRDGRWTLSLVLDQDLRIGPTSNKSVGLMMGFAPWSP